MGDRVAGRTLDEDLHDERMTRRRGDGDGGGARAGACEGDVRQQCPALAPNIFPPPQCAKDAGHREGFHVSAEGVTWLAGFRRG